jgi:hypothetical protein
MSTKPKMLDSKPRPIIIPPTGLSQAENRKLNKYNEPNKCISLPNMRLRRFNLASFFPSYPRRAKRKERTYLSAPGFTIK